MNPEPDEFVDTKLLNDAREHFTPGPGPFKTVLREQSNGYVSVRGADGDICTCYAKSASSQAAAIARALNIVFPTNPRPVATGGDGGGTVPDLETSAQQEDIT